MEFAGKVNNEYTFDQFRVDFHEFCDFIPIVSTITNTIAVVQKCLYVPDMDADPSIDDSTYYTYLKAKNFGEEWQLFIPGVNFIFCVLRCCCASPSTAVDEDRPVDDPEIGIKMTTVIPEKIDALKTETIQKKPEVLNEITKKINKEEENEIPFANEVVALKSETILKLSDVLNKITDATSNEEKSVVVRGISSSITEFFNIFYPDINPWNRNLSHESWNILQFCAEKSHEIKQAFILDLIDSCKSLSLNQRKVLIQGFQECEEIPFLSVNLDFYKAHNLETKIERPDNIWFSEIIKLYETEPDVAKFLLQEAVKTYSSGKTRHNKALDYLVKCIRTKEQAMDYLEACQDLSQSIKEDNYLKLALYTQSYTERTPVVFSEKGQYEQQVFLEKIVDGTKTYHFAKKDLIIAAFEEMGINYEPLLLKNNWLTKDINQDIVNVIYSKLPIEDLSKLSRTCQIKSEEHSISGYVHKHLVEKPSARLQRLFELYNRLTSSKESSKQKIHFLKELNGLIESLRENPAVLLNDKELLPVTNIESYLEKYVFDNSSRIRFKETIKHDTFNNHLFGFMTNELLSKFNFSSESDAALLSNCLDLLFKNGTDEQLEKFIIEFILPSDFEQLELREKCLYQQLTDERIKRLASIVQTKDVKVGCIILQNIMRCVNDVYLKELKNKAWTSENIQIIEIAEKLVINFYNIMPDLNKWENLINKLKGDRVINEKGCLFDLGLDGAVFVQFFALAETLMFLNQPIELDEQIRLEGTTKKHDLLGRMNCSNVSFWNNFLPKRYVERTLLHICEAQEDFAIKEKKLVNFVHSILIKDRSFDPHKLSYLLFNLCSEIDFEDQELTIKIQTNIYSVMVEIFNSYDYIQNLTEYIKKEQQFHVFYKILHSLPEPSRTIQLTILRDRICKEIAGLEENFRNDLLINGLNLEWEMVVALNDVQIFVDAIYALKNLDQLTVWLKKNRMDHFKLQALARGIKMPDGSLLQCSMEPNMIKEAFLNEKLYYKGYAEPIGLKAFIDEYAQGK